MGIHFHWQTETEFTPEPGPKKPQRPSDALIFWLLTAVILLLLGSGWFTGQRRLAQSQAEQQAAVQAQLDLQRQAFLSGDGDLFFSFFGDEPAWRAAQLRPEQQAVWRAGFDVTRVEVQGELRRVNVTWREGEMAYQRLLFFTEHNGRLHLTATDSDFWGRSLRRDTAWGELYSLEADEAWADQIASFVADALTAFCPHGCEGRLPLTLLVGDGYEETAVSHALNLPSPRLVALDEQGQPGTPYWELVNGRLAAYFTPAVIRFALPPANFLGLHTFDYQRLAADFMASHPDVQIELITLDAIPADHRELAQYDGAAFPPSLVMIVSGAVYDLTPLAESDPLFAPGDFYGQIWQGGWWQNRMWFMPQTASLKLIFVNRDLYAQTSRSEPSLRWTWQEMDDDLAALSGPVAALDSPPQHTLFLDPGPDTLLAYAYNWGSACEGTTAVHCSSPLTPEQIAAALDWYQGLPVQPCLLEAGETPCLERRWNWQAAIRVEEPLYYEHLLQMSPLGVTTFPGSAQFDGVTPLWVEGSFISQSSQNPLAVWRWLLFLSYQAPLPRYRLIPARPSVAQETAYWQTLPRALSEPLRAALPFARPVLLDEKGYLTMEGITAVLSGQRTPEEVASQSARIIWFGP